MNANKKRDGVKKGAEFWGKFFAAIVLFAVLLWLALGFYHPIGDYLEKQRAALLYKELTLDLSSYKLENGWYPVNSGDEKEGAFVLYKYLSGDFDEDGAVDSETAGNKVYMEGNKVYMEGLDWNTAKNDPLKRVRKIGGRFALIDPYGDLIRYRCEPEEQEKRSTRNPTYDLWSLGGAESDADTMSNRSRWLTNWD